MAINGYFILRVMNLKASDAVSTRLGPFQLHLRERGLSVAAGAVGYINPPFELKEGEDLTLRIFIDKSMIEVFANDRQAAVAWHEYKPENLNVSLFSKGDDLVVKRVTAWKMKSIYESTRAR